MLDDRASNKTTIPEKLQCHSSTGLKIDLHNLFLIAYGKGFRIHGMMIFIIHSDT
jgi:hypothetical protein